MFWLIILAGVVLIIAAPALLFGRSVGYIVNRSTGRR